MLRGRHVLHGMADGSILCWMEHALKYRKQGQHVWVFPLLQGLVVGLAG